MPVNPALNSRAGGQRFLNLANTMCRFVRESGPSIRLRYPANLELMAALTAAEAACALLPAANQEWYDTNAADLPAFDAPDGTLLPGQTT